MPDESGTQESPEADLLGGRLRRTAALGRLAATEAAKYAATSAANLGRTPDEAADALGRRQVDAARQIVRVLGSMKGVAMKAGQMLSVVDLDAVPPAYREEVRATLAELRDSAPTVSFSDMRKVLERDYGEQLERVFATFDEEPIAAASIGQVYRATLDDGREVAVKVQYPGIAAAVRADLQNLVPLLRVAKQIAPNLDVDELAAEVRDRIHEELDYELEAENTRAVARAHRGHPFIVIPEVVTDLCRTHVIVMDFVRGASHEEIARRDQATRDRVAEMIFRFYFGAMYRHRAFSGDPHPGNSMLLDDGRMAFLDFGLFKRLSAQAAERELEIQRLGVEGRGEDMIERMRAAGMLPDSSRATPESILDQFRRYTWWYTRRRDRRARPGDGDADRPGLLRPAARRLPRGAPRDAARRARLRPPAGDDDARGHEPAAPARQLVPDRARMAVRRRAAHRARPARGRVLRRPAMSGAIPPSAPSREARRIRRRGPGPQIRLAMLALALGSLFLVLALSGSLSPEKVEDWVDGFGAVAPLVFIVVRGDADVSHVPGADPRGRVGPAVRHRARHAGRDLLGDARRLPGGEHRPVRRGRRGPGARRPAHPGARRRGSARRGFTSVLYARIAPAMPYNLVNYACGLTTIPILVIAAGTAVGTAPRTFAYVALGGSFGDFSSPEAIIAFAIILGMGMTGLLLIRRDLLRERATARDPAA